MANLREDIYDLSNTISKFEDNHLAFTEYKDRSLNSISIELYQTLEEARGLIHMMKNKLDEQREILRNANP